MKRLWVYVVYKRLFGKIRMTFFYDNYGRNFRFIILNFLILAHKICFGYCLEDWISKWRFCSIITVFIEGIILNLLFEIVFDFYGFSFIK